MVATFMDNITYLTKIGFKPIFNIIDNVASKSFKKYLEEDKIKIQMAEPHNHRVNAAERVIQTFKNHNISGFSTCDERFPSFLRCKLINMHKAR